MTLCDINVIFMNKKIEININNKEKECSICTQAHSTHESKNSKYIQIKNVCDPNQNLSSFHQQYITSELFTDHCRSFIFTVNHLFSRKIMDFRWLCVASDKFVLLAISLVIFLYH
jgi:hypothetical protein